MKNEIQQNPKSKPAMFSGLVSYGKSVWRRLTSDEVVYTFVSDNEKRCVFKASETSGKAWYVKIFVVGPERIKDMEREAYAMKLLAKKRANDLPYVLQMLDWGWNIPQAMRDKLLTLPSKCQAALKAKYNIPYIITEELEPNIETLGEWLAKQPGTIPSERIRSIMFQLTFGVAYLQAEYGIVHNDLYENNVLLRPVRTPQTLTYATTDQDLFELELEPGDFQVYLFDFGSARILAGAAANQDEWFRTSETALQHNNPPEQFFTVNNDNKHSEADYWMLGHILLSLVGHGNAFGYRYTKFRGPHTFGLNTADAARLNLTEDEITSDIGLGEKSVLLKKEKDEEERVLMTELLFLNLISLDSMFNGYDVAMEHTKLPYMGTYKDVQAFLARIPVNSARQFYVERNMEWLGDALKAEDPLRFEFARACMQFDPQRRRAFGLPTTGALSRPFGLLPALFHPYFRSIYKGRKTKKTDPFGLLEFVPPLEYASAERQRARDDAVLNPARESFYAHLLVDYIIDANPNKLILTSRAILAREGGELNEVAVRQEIETGNPAHVKSIQTILNSIRPLRTKDDPLSVQIFVTWLLLGRREMTSTQRDALMVVMGQPLPTDEEEEAKRKADEAKRAEVEKEAERKRQLEEEQKAKEKAEEAKREQAERDRQAKEQEEANQKAQEANRQAERDRQAAEQQTLERCANWIKSQLNPNLLDAPPAADDNILAQANDCLAYIHSHANRTDDKLLQSIGIRDASGRLNEAAWNAPAKFDYRRQDDKIDVVRAAQNAAYLALGLMQVQNPYAPEDFATIRNSIQAISGSPQEMMTQLKKVVESIPLFASRTAQDVQSDNTQVLAKIVALLKKMQAGVKQPASKKEGGIQPKDLQTRFVDPMREFAELVVKEMDDASYGRLLDVWPLELPKKVSSHGWGDKQAKRFKDRYWPMHSIKLKSTDKTKRDDILIVPTQGMLIKDLISYSITNKISEPEETMYEIYADLFLHIGFMIAAYYAVKGEGWNKVEALESQQNLGALHEKIRTFFFPRKDKVSKWPIPRDVVLKQAFGLDSITGDAFVKAQLSLTQIQANLEIIETLGAAYVDPKSRSYNRIAVHRDFIAPLMAEASKQRENMSDEVSTIFDSLGLFGTKKLRVSELHETRYYHTLSVACDLLGDLENHALCERIQTEWPSSLIMTK